MDAHYTEEDLNRLRNICGFGPGYCKCGCGEKTTKHRNKYRKYICGHHKGNWQGGRIVDSAGYVFIKMREHPQANNKGYIREHTLMMEKALGRAILPTEHIHHIDSDRQNNTIGNLMLFKTNSMHVAYEARLRAFAASGHYDWRQCCICHEYDDPINLYINNTNARHLKCAREYASQKK